MKKTLADTKREILTDLLRQNIINGRALLYTVVFDQGEKRRIINSRRVDMRNKPATDTYEGEYVK